MTTGKKIRLGLLCGLAVGLVVPGVGGRLVMRLIAVLNDAPTAFSLGGTLEVVAFGALVGTPSGLFYVAVRSYVPGAVWLRGLALGALMFVMALLWPSNAGNAAAGFPALYPWIVAMAAALFLAHGLILAAMIERWIGRGAPPGEDG